MIAFLVTFALSTTWALASPIFSVPDENAHALKAIAQLQGQVVGYTLPDVKHIVVDLGPEDAYHGNIMCFVTHPDVTANCGNELGDPKGQLWFNTWVGAYNPVYYYLVGWPSLILDGNASVYGMRIASAFLGAVLLAFAFQAATSGARSRWMPLGVAFAAAPMSLYLIGSVNPNGAEIASAVALWASLLRLLESFDESSERPAIPRPWLWAIVTASAIVLVNARATGPLWLVVVLAACLLAAGWERTKRLFTTPASYWWIGGVALGGLFSIGWTLSRGSLSSQAEASDAPLVNGTFLQGFTYMIRMTPDIVQQAIGFFGWFDTPLPLWVYWFFVAAVALVVVLATAATRRRSVMVMLLLLAAAILVPAFVQAYSVHQTGFIWQGRYGLFLYLGVVIAATWLLSRDAPRISFLAPRLTWVVASLLGVYGIIAFGLVMVRYVIGRAPFGEMLSAPQWQPPLGWPALVFAYVAVSVAGVVALGLTARHINQQELHADRRMSAAPERSRSDA
ncbi:DUF2142 domain-containing protein [Agromyces albus]|uniref:DUF2142 domain-containing protein n=1 Tax=Agromyces albus TaxID=205332 RepID=UPI0027D80128|nr:DUF2142 domain-containing protein [Agromyces albus]